MTTAPIALIHHDAHLLVVDKPAGLLVHRSALDAHETDTLVERLQRQLGLGPQDFLAPAHRLDKGTSGLLVLARQRAAAQALGLQFDPGHAAPDAPRPDRPHRRYLTLVRGWPPLQTRVDHPLARDPERPSQGQVQLAASTWLRRLARVEWPFTTDPRHPGSRYALVLAEPQTGRRHQIRRHLKHLAHPVVGDSTHGKGQHNRAVAAWTGHPRLWLHALGLRLAHPADGRPLALQAAPGPEWAHLLGLPGWTVEPDLPPLPPAHGPDALHAWADALATLDIEPAPAAPSPR
ncbi:pseudouridine synthase [Ideonella livida]|uniref:tRNA pseudouridine synthase C n=1 Tax=Ideonella livida TaxID=2707176 RepID=A0A7C9TJW7_9BURK|nr:pseudouridine synthase [Ideonella livida]NDY89926.1 pseudouridine synthase [Ideonella livida]